MIFLYTIVVRKEIVQMKKRFGAERDENAPIVGLKDQIVKVA